MSRAIQLTAGDAAQVEFARHTAKSGDTMLVTNDQVRPFEPPVSTPPTHLHVRRYGSSQCSCGWHLPASFPSMIASRRSIEMANEDLRNRPSLYVRFGLIDAINRLIKRHGSAMSASCWLIPHLQKLEKADRNGLRYAFWLSVHLSLASRARQAARS